MSKVHVKTGDTVILLTGKYEDKYDKNGDRKTGCRSKPQGGQGNR